MTGASPQPQSLHRLFWEYGLDALDWEEDRDLVTGRVLAAANWETVKRLRGRIGDERLRSWMSIDVALVYFQDADQERMPRLLWNVEWPTIKKTIQTWVKELAG